MIFAGAGLSLAAAYLVVNWALAGGTGLVRTVAADGGRQPLDPPPVDRVDARGLEAGGGSGLVTFTWHGAWQVPASGVYDLALRGNGAASWAIDGHLAQAASPGDAAHPARTVWLARGYHAIDIGYTPDAESPFVEVAAARAGREPAPLAGAELRSRVPRHPGWRQAGVVARTLLGWLALAACACALRNVVRAQWDRWRNRSASGNADAASGRLTSGSGGVWLRRGLAWTALAGILAHGALLRVDAITAQYGAVTVPAWLSALQTRAVVRPEAIRPASMALRPEGLYPHHDGRSSHYRGDPYTYLEAARQMTSFYAAHWREPVFPYATRAWLRLLNGQDVAVSFASTGFSILAIWLTYILGAALWSRPVGLAAALVFSLDADVVAYASYGFRDDAYVALVVCSAWLMVRCWRTLREPPRARHVGRLRIDAAHVDAVALGVAAGLAVLTRIMAVPFLFAGGVFLLLAPRPPWRRRASMVVVVTLTATVVVAPYFVNCWRVYGDPLYTFNIHGSVYGAAEGQGERTGSTASYVGEKIARRPAQSLDTVAEGLTTYPFANKWRGLDHWHAGLGRWASLAALGGLLVLAATSPGRLLLVAFAGALLPFSFTWKVDPDFRFTEFLYPFLLVAAATALAAAARGGRTVFLGGTVAGPRAARDISWRWAGVVAGLAIVALWFVTHVSPAWAFGESVRSGESTSITVGSRDGAFFDGRWSDMVRGVGVDTRVALSSSSISVFLPNVAAYPVTLRMDPFPRPLEHEPRRLPVVELRLNDAPLAVLTLTWNPQRMGTYDLVLPRALVRRGANRLELRVRRPGDAPPGSVQPGLTDGDAIALWYLRVHPPLQ